MTFLYVHSQFQKACIEKKEKSLRHLKPIPPGVLDFWETVSERAGKKRSLIVCLSKKEKIDQIMAERIELQNQ